MEQTSEAIASFLQSVPPYDDLAPGDLAALARHMRPIRVTAGTTIYHAGKPIKGLYIIVSGQIEILDPDGAFVSSLGSRHTFGERGLLRDGLAATTARASQESSLLLLPAQHFLELLKQSPTVERFFSRSRHNEARTTDLASQKVVDLLARAPLSCTPETTVSDAARQMRDAHVSSLGVTHPDTSELLGLITVRDLANRVVAEGLDPATPVAQVMSVNPVSLPSSALGSDVLHIMLEHKVGHLPIVDHERFVGMITQTDLTRFQAVSASALVRDVARASSADHMRGVTDRIPQLLVQLVGMHSSHEVITRLITDITDAVTRRLLALAHAELGPAPVPYLWLACGSQGRQEQTGVSDQDNCLFLDDSVRAEHMPYFEELARRVCDGLNACGYVYCPGDMMASNPRWRQPVHVWRRYFHEWAVTHKPESHMLASVMFDLRPISGATHLFQSLQAQTLEAASRNSIFVAHMVANSLKHAPPLGLIRGFSTVRSGPYRDHIDLKHNGVIPVTDLARVYALQGQLTPVNTRARLLAAGGAGVISASGMRDLVEAYDMIALTRLENQAGQIRTGKNPSNYLAPSDLSDFERNHLRDAFVVVRTMQSALGRSKGLNR